VSRRPTGDRRFRRTWLIRRITIAVRNRRVFLYLVGVTAAVAVATGFVAHLIDPDDFPSFGVGVWWAIVTLGTVGYGDVVPHTPLGRFLGGVVIVVGVTFISFLIAIVTSILVDANRADIDDATDARHDETQRLLRNIDARLTNLEATIGSAPDGSDEPRG
jgi:voltage-gated potassium channel Kch